MHSHGHRERRLIFFPLKTRKLLVFNSSNGMGEVLGRVSSGSVAGWGAMELARSLTHGVALFESWPVS